MGRVAARIRDYFTVQVLPLADLGVKSQNPGPLTFEDVPPVMVVMVGRTVDGVPKLITCDTNGRL